MSVKPGDSVSVQFVTEDENRNAFPAALPLGTIVRNGSDDGAVVVSVLSAGPPEAWQASFTVPALYVAGDQVQLRVNYVAGLRFNAQDFVWERTLETLPATGVGADQVTITITDPSTTFPIGDADVWITSDQAGTNVVAGSDQTNGAGKVLFLLDDSVNYYLWMQKDGFKSIRGQLFTAVADP